jgi:hypothetical protein
LSICAVLLSLAFYGSAQTSSSISGTVKDASGAVVSGAKVVLTNQDSNASRPAKSNGEGFFYFAGVQPATYSVEVSYAGFERWKVTGITVHPGDNLSIPKINLQIGAVSMSVTVTAEVAGVSLSSGEHSTLITAGQIQRLSTVGRDAQELISILPGFTMQGSVENQSLDYQKSGFGGNLGSLGANGAAPQSGLVNITSDGANVIDPGDMGGQISSVNMDQVQEVKVQTSNFGADQARGPIVINAIGKAGSSGYHGSLYTYWRNYNLNANEWVSKHFKETTPETKYLYPGGSFGGPIKIPGTRFNQSKRLVFWTGYELYRQDAYNSLVEAFVPTPAMLKGDLRFATLADALNVSVGDSPTDVNGIQYNCASTNVSAWAWTNIGSICHSPSASGAVDQDNVAFSEDGVIPDVEPGIAAYTRFYPKANHVPQKLYKPDGSISSVSDGFNYIKNMIDTDNGFQSHSRVDANISDSLKLYVTYNWEKVNTSTTTTSAFNYSGTNNPIPTPFESHTGAQYLTLNMIKTLSASLTNELILSAVKFNEPMQYTDRSKVLDTGTAWASAGYSGGATPQAMYGSGPTATKTITENQLPMVGTWDGVGFPSFAAAYVPASRGQFENKYTWSAADNLTKIFRTHSIKAGFYADQTGDNERSGGSNVNGTLRFMRWGGCYVNEAATNPYPSSANAPKTTGTGNQIGQFLTGCPLQYSQDSMDPNANLRDTVIEGYVTDEWKVSSKLTVTAGIRLSHLEPWTDRHGVGLAVWDPSQLTQHELLSITSQDPKYWPGFKWHKKDPSVPMAGVPTRALFYSPRFSLAYDVFGNGKTVLRGGWGSYYSHDGLFYVVGSSLPLGKESWTTSAAGTDCSFAQIFSTSVVPCGNYTRSTVSGQLSPFSVSAQDPHDDRMPVTYNYNFTLDQSLPWKMQAEIAYVGNQSSDIATQSNLQNQNVMPLGAEFGPDPAHGSSTYGQVFPTANIPNSGNDFRPYPNYQSINVPSHKAWANYNGLQASLNKQTGSLIYSVNYTWSKALAVRGSWDSGTTADPINMNHDYGIAAFDRSHVINATYAWQEGSKFHGNHILAAAANGWEVSGVITLESGPDLAILTNGSSSTNFGLNGGVGYYPLGSTGPEVSNQINSSVWLGTGDYTLQPTVTCNPRAHLKKNQFINGNCFGLPAQGTEGPWNLPKVSGPKYFKWDMSVYKDFKISDRQNMQFRLAGFNFLNHPITSFSTQDTGNPLTLNVSDDSLAEKKYTTLEQALAGAHVVNPNTFGYTAFKHGQRILELGFKYNF